MNTGSQDSFYSSDEFQNYFKNGARSMLLKANAPDFTILAASDVFLALVQKERSELLNCNMTEVFPGNASDPSGKNSVLHQLEVVLRDKKITERLPFVYEIYMAHSGTWETGYWTNLNEPVLDEQGEVAYIINTTTNVTQQVLDERALQEAGEVKASLRREQELNEELAATNEELQATQHKLSVLNAELEARIAHRTGELLNTELRWRSIIEQAPVGFCILTGKELRIEYANALMLSLWGKDKTVIGMLHAEARQEPEMAAFLTILDDVYRTGKSFTGSEVKAYTAKGNTNEWGYFNFIYQAIRDEKGATTGILALVEDVTEKVLARNETERSGTLLKLALDASDMGSWYLRSDTREMIASPRFKELYGFYSADDITVSDTIGQITGKHRDTVAAAMEEAITKGSNYNITYEVEGFHDKKIRWIQATGSLVPDPSGEYSGFAGILTDVTKEVDARTELQLVNDELAATNEELSASNEELSRANENLNASNNELWLAQNDLLDLNRKLAESEERFRNMAESMEVFIGMSDETGNAIYFNGIWSQTTGRSNEMLLKYGWADLVHPEDRERALDTYKEAIQNKTPFTNEFRILTKENNYIWLFVQGIPRVHSNGSFAGHIGSSFDITERKRDDQRKNDFIGMVSHEMKTPLTSLSGYLQMIQLLSKEQQEQLPENIIDKAYRQVGKMTKLINGFLNVSRLESGKIQIDKTQFDMAELVREAEEEAHSTISSHNVVFHPVECTRVYADRDKIGQVISNLISNAVKYSPANTVISVSCFMIGDSAAVSVSDAGIGIKPEDQPRLFDRYYRVSHDMSTSPSGFGIGLYLCAEIVHRHDGKIWMESEVGKGSTFLFTLPGVA